MALCNQETFFQLFFTKAAFSCIYLWLLLIY